MRGATTSATVARARCSTCSSTRQRPDEKPSADSHQTADQRGRKEARQGGQGKAGGDRGSAALLPRCARGGHPNYLDRCGGGSFSSGRLRPAGGATFLIASS